MVFIKYLALLISAIAFSAQLSASSEFEDTGCFLNEDNSSGCYEDRSAKLSVRLMLRSGNGWSVERELGVWREGENAASSLCPLWAHSNCNDDVIVLDGGTDRIDESPLTLQCMWLLNDVQNGAMIMGPCGGEDIIIKAFSIND